MYLEIVLGKAVLKSNCNQFSKIYGESRRREETVSKLETVYGIVASFDVLIQYFHKISQDPNEKIPAYTTRIEGALTVEEHLRE